MLNGYVSIAGAQRDYGVVVDAASRTVDRAATDALRAARNHINSGDHWRFSPDTSAAVHAARRTVTAPPGSLLLLATDGFTALATDYGAYDAQGLMMAAVERGVEALAAEARAIEEDDPLGRKFPRFKKSDDCTALLLKVS